MARVSLTKRVVVPPNSVVRVACKLDDQLGDYYLEPGDLIHQRKVLMPYIVRSAGDRPIICMVNPTNNFKTLKKNEIIANAHEIDTILGDMHSANTRMASSQSSGSNCVAASSPTELKHGARSVAASSPTNSSIGQGHKDERNIAVELSSHLHGVFEASRTHLNAEQE